MSYYDTVYLGLLYVLSIIGTFAHIYVKARMARVRFRPFFALIASLFWPVFFVYLANVEFRK